MGHRTVGTHTLNWVPTLPKLMVAGDSAGGSSTNACVLQDEKGIIRKIMGISSFVGRFRLP